MQTVTYNHLPRFTPGMKSIFLPPNDGRIPPSGFIVIDKLLCYGRHMSNIGEIVTIHIDNKPSLYARIEGIELDMKPDWFQIRLLMLSFPPQEVTWILRGEYIEGTPFTMQGIPMEIHPLPVPGSFAPIPESDEDEEEKPRPSAPQEEPAPQQKGAAVISMAERRARKKDQS